MLKGKKKPVADQGPRLLHQIITRARGGRERRRLKAGKIKNEKAVTFCNPPHHTVIQRSKSPPIVLGFQTKMTSDR